MVIGFDPVSRTVILDFEDGTPQIELPTSGLVAKFYLDQGIASATMIDSYIDITFIPAPGEEPEVELCRTGTNTWQLVARPGGS